MDWDLYNKYGEYNKDGYYIEDHSKWHYYAQRPKLYRRKKVLAWCWMLIPICGIIGTTLSFEEMGLSCL
jgi:hypothetical protein